MVFHKRTVAFLFVLASFIMALTLADIGVCQDTLTVTKSASPDHIWVAGTGKFPEYTTVTITVTGFGGLTTDRLPMDVVYAIDSSGSMDWNDPSNLRLEAAKEFTDKLDSAKDQGGVVSWDNNIDFTYGLTDDFSLTTNVGLKWWINQVDSSGGTNLDVGLAAAIAMLDANPRVEDSVEVIIFLSNGAGGYTPSGGGGPVDDAVAKGYVIYSIGLNVGSGSWEESNLIDMATATGGQYFSAPTADALQDIFDAIFQIVVISTAPIDVDVIEVTQDYIIDESSFSPTPNSVTENMDGTTTIRWNDVGSIVGDMDGYLTAAETFVATFQAKCNKGGNQLPVDVDGSAIVTFIDPAGNPCEVPIPQAYIWVWAPPVGGVWAPVNIIELLAPWIVVALIAAAVVAAAGTRRFFTKRW